METCERCDEPIVGEPLTIVWRTKSGEKLPLAFCGPSCERAFREGVEALAATRMVMV